MAPPDRTLEVDLYGSAVVFEEFERVIAPGGAGLIVSSMAGHMSPTLPAEQEHDLAFAPADELMKTADFNRRLLPSENDQRQFARSNAPGHCT